MMVTGSDLVGYWCLSVSRGTYGKYYNNSEVNDWLLLWIRSYMQICVVAVVETPTPAMRPLKFKP